MGKVVITNGVIVDSSSSSTIEDDSNTIDVFGYKVQYYQIGIFLLILLVILQSKGFILGLLFVLFFLYIRKGLWQLLCADRSSDSSSTSSASGGNNSSSRSRVVGLNDYPKPAKNC